VLGGNQDTYNIHTSDVSTYKINGFTGSHITGYVSPKG
jgi:hypothetical protein